MATSIQKRKPQKRPNQALTAIQTLNLLKRHYPDAHCALNYSNAFELLVATILSAQCTDVRVNMVTPHVFARYPSPAELARASQEELEEIIRSTGFYKNKAKSLIGAAMKIVDHFHGEVPKRLEDLVSLPGVGRKTANVVLGNAFGISSGVVVDTHVTRLTNRFGWVQSKDAVKIEVSLQKLFPKSEWIMLSHYLISHGRATCKAPTPKCEACFLVDHCPQIGVK